MTRRRIVLLVLVLAPVAAAAVVALERASLARNLILAELRARGVPDPRISVGGIGLRALTLRDLRAGSAGELTLDELVVRYSAGSLRAGRLEALELSGLRVRASLGPDGLSFGSLDALRAPETGATTPPPRTLPVERVRIRSARLALATDAGDLDVSASGEFADGELKLEAELAAGALTAGDEAVPLPALRLSGRVVPGPRGATFELRLSDHPERLALEARGELAPTGGTGRVSFRLEPLEFAPGKLQPGDLLPALATLGELTGTVEARGELELGGEAGGGRIDVALRDGALRNPLARFEHVDAALRLLGPAPLSTPPGQLVSVGRVDFGLALVNGLVSYRLRPDGVLDIESARFELAGGEVATAGRIDPRAPVHRLFLTVSDMDLARLLDLVKLEGLGGEGRVAGVLPVEHRGGALAIRAGRLATTQAGWLRYRPASRVRAVVGNDPHLAMVLAALANFRYDALTLGIDGEARGEVRLSLHLSGANPDYRDGQPFDFNLNLDGRLSDLLRDAAAVYELPASVEKRIRAITEGR